MTWKRQPESGLYDFDLNGWWIPVGSLQSSEVYEVLTPDRWFGGVFLGEVE